MQCAICLCTAMFTMLKKKTLFNTYVSEPIHQVNILKALLNRKPRGVDMIQVEKKTVSNTTIPEMGT